MPQTEDIGLEKFFSHERPSYPFKSTVAQFLATLASSLMFLGVGMMTAEITIVNESFRSGGGDAMPIYADLLFVLQPVGCIIGAFIPNLIGRKAGMILSNILALFSWVLLHEAMMIFTYWESAIMMGLSAGLMYSTGLAYVGEITEPRLRDVMIPFINMALPIGVLVEFFLSSYFRETPTMSAISCSIPVISFILFAFIPDSPMWLLSKGKDDDALLALCWLRGWTNKEVVKIEFNDMCLYARPSENLPNISSKNDVVCCKISQFFKKVTSKPFGPIILYRVFFNCAVPCGIREENMRDLFVALGMPTNTNWLILLPNSLMILGGLSCMLSVNRMGKEKLTLISMFLCTIDGILLGAYSYYKSNVRPLPYWVPMIFLYSLYFFNTFGIGNISWMLISEMFPQRSRSKRIGMLAALFLIIDFLFEIIYSQLQQTFNVSGTFFLYGICGWIGFRFLHKHLSETRGKTLAEVEKLVCLKKNVKSPIVRPHTALNV